MRQMCVFRQALTNHRDANINTEELFVRVLGKLYFKFPPKIHARTDTFVLRTLRRERIGKASEPQRNARRDRKRPRKNPNKRRRGRDVFKAIPGTFVLRTLQRGRIEKASEPQRNAGRGQETAEKKTRTRAKEKGCIQNHNKP